MGKFRALLALQLKAMLFSFHVGGKSKRRAFSGAGVLLLMGGLALYLSATYSFLFAAQLAPLGMLPLLILMMPVLAVVAGGFFTLFSAQGIVFGGKDNDLMLALPVSAFTLLLSRVLALYLENLVFSLFVMLPAGAAYLWYGGAGGVRFALVLLLSVPFLALLPTLLSLVCGFVLSWVSGKFVRRRAISLVLYAALLAAALAGGFQVNFLLADLASAAMGIQQALSVWCVPFLWLQQAACDGNALSLLAFCALCLLPFLALTWLFAARYKTIVTSLGAHGARSDYRLVSVAAGSQRKALLKKEAARFFGTPIYLFNAGLGLVFLLLAGFAALLFRRDLGPLLTQLETITDGISPALLAAGAVCFLLSTVSISASSISLESRQLWILKTAPVSAPTLFTVKVGFQLLLTLPCLTVSTLCLSAALGLPPAEWLPVLAVSAVFALASALFGLYGNLCFPKLDAPNDTVVVKQSAAAMLGVFVPMAAVALAALLCFLLRDLLAPSLLLLLCAGLFLLCALALLSLLRRHGPALLAAL